MARKVIVTTRSRLFTSSPQEPAPPGRSPLLLELLELLSLLWSRWQSRYHLLELEGEPLHQSRELADLLCLRLDKLLQALHLRRQAVKA
jgi:hypothetical protein